MRIAVAADERTAVTDAVVAMLRERGHEIVALLGPIGGGAHQWADCGRGVGEAVAKGEADQGVVCCWTGTGVTIAANKVAGVRAALCTDAEQARGARRWNDANVLALSIRLTSPAVAEEILDAWFSSEADESERANIDKLDS